MFTENTNIMLYVEDVATEKAFWSAIGFDILNESEIMGYTSFDMKSHPESTRVFTIYANEFIKQVSPEVLDFKPSVLFETKDIETLHTRVSVVTDTVSQINTVPFLNFNFANPSGHYFAVRASAHD